MCNINFLIRQVGIEDFANLVEAAYSRRQAAKDFLYIALPD
jgi:hypothetical protein